MYSALCKTLRFGSLILLPTSYVLLLTEHAGAYVPGKFYPPMHVAPRKRTSEKIIALTFDDGPGKFTVPILELLKKHNIHATFFMLGDQVEEYPAIAKQVLDEGHEIGNHTYTHFDYHKQKNAAPERLVHELAQTESSLQRAFHNPEFRTKLVRMPYGYFNHTWLLPTLKEHGYALVHWDFGEDWLRMRRRVPGHRGRSENEISPSAEMVNLTPEVLADDYIKNAGAGTVFLFHDGGRRRERTLAALTLVVEQLEKEGYRFVPAKELFKDETP